jgi:hypothetical protein
MDVRGVGQDLLLDFLLIYHARLVLDGRRCCRVLVDVAFGDLDSHATAVADVFLLLDVFEG